MEDKRSIKTHKNVSYICVTIKACKIKEKQKSENQKKPSHKTAEHYT